MREVARESLSRPARLFTIYYELPLFITLPFSPLSARPFFARGSPFRCPAAPAGGIPLIECPRAGCPPLSGVVAAATLRAWAPPDMSYEAVALHARAPGLGGPAALPSRAAAFDAIGPVCALDIPAQGHCAAAGRRARLRLWPPPPRL